MINLQLALTDRQYKRLESCLTLVHEVEQQSTHIDPFHEVVSLVAEAYHSHTNLITCTECNHEFQWLVGQRKPKYCSDGCRQRAYRRRKKHRAMLG